MDCFQFILSLKTRTSRSQMFFFPKIKTELHEETDLKKTSSLHLLFLKAELAVGEIFLVLQQYLP